ncbi:hypothetical protein HRR83_006347 [Exophiala dermatitidis]|uniref:Uncharacterized protein n=1 Tax=Exophiala dermatitidis TaxID=5970 RepID=A0AAN6EN93_EXODE|nr:hypothetical protein HRR73_007205 [Exophiala dermatitidis]KAJ4509538.1 hypothetical protein HRR74_007319 [Exophiala dermatitidis]KAJ4530540.1 hypothetical protein HRR76_008247 [Exophiala dermatitidis]KAJ4545291.1 hypothetical protein HRR77_005141 [Exophiala dermatitidis]KAJ4570850.1 hypothetical protein HRR79_003782 [Exophiala dermatitidis]
MTRLGMRFRQQFVRTHTDTQTHIHTHIHNVSTVDIFAPRSSRLFPGRLAALHHQNGRTERPTAPVPIRTFNRVEQPRHLDLSSEAFSSPHNVSSGTTNDSKHPSSDFTYAVPF